ncbi:hypothetical protein ETAA8_46580 [Anatilimnocola aggregata]|uniref:Uncharacterized protein n=1 Tax=Anatilimnocola aggregata TaxID=2528021 RepID=A0A517YH23_9BACT|nr:hypothetical protein [Anatilimnocola aggregata]QDU29544.1 hypothetical protein ETAA8_46580 [Anatilimnocola aggregata]
MIRPRQVFLLAALILVGAITAADAQEPTKRFLGKLKVGQEVTLKEANGRYEIIVLKRLPLGHKIVGIGDDYIELLDVSGVTTTIIPVYSIRSITRLELPQK